MKNYKSIRSVVHAITFAELVEHGKNQEGANIVNGMPWSFDFQGYQVTHENDECYLIPLNHGFIRFESNEILVLNKVDEPFTMLKIIFDKCFIEVE